MNARHRLYVLQLLWVLACLGSGLGIRAASAFTPESPEVKVLIEKAIPFLEKASRGDRFGERAIVALALLKTRGVEHPRVVQTIKELTDQNTSWEEVENYSLGITIILLSEIGRTDLLPDIQKLVDKLVKRQKDHGGFGYDGHGGATMSTGDVSQTQYAALALWSAKQVGADIPRETVEKMLDWLLRVQDVSGGWGYQGLDPGSRRRVKQPDDGHPVGHSFTAGGLGSVCVCCDLFDIKRNIEIAQDGGKMPTALKQVQDPKDKKKNFGKPAIPIPEINASIEDGTKWFEKNYKIKIDHWQLYYMYGLERCESFRELYNGTFTREPQWYNDGVKHLTETQADAGNWGGEWNSVVSTSFAVLFLVRSARKSIMKAKKDLGDGVLTSGRGLPVDLANASIKRGKLVDSALSGEVDDLMSLLNDPDNPELLRLAEGDAKLTLEKDISKREGQITKLKNMVSAGSWETRIVAVRTLGQARDLDFVPSLLYAMTDPDPRVVVEADKALRFLSRRFKGVGLEGELNRPMINKARQDWREWYLSIRPDAELFDQ
jgi:Squalene-hopene cyclase C-terminal domain